MKIKNDVIYFLQLSVIQLNIVIFVQKEMCKLYKFTFIITKYYFVAVLVVSGETEFQFLATQEHRIVSETQGGKPTEQFLFHFVIILLI
jgi:hypothetical protein